MDHHTHDAGPGGLTDTREPDLGSDPSDAATEPLGRAAALGTLWLTGQKWVIRLSGFVTIAILTRLVSPEDFGIVAAAAAVTPLVLLLADLGLSTFIVQADRVDSRMLTTGFWFSVTAGTLLSGALALLAPLIASAFNIHSSSAVLRVMSLAVLLAVVSSVPMALLRRRMQFKLLAVQATVGAVIAQVVAVGLAFSGAGAWALVAQALVSQAVVCVLAWRSARWRPGIGFSPRTFRAMASFGSQVVAVELVATSRAAAEAAVVSNALGAAALGYMSIAQRLVQIAQDLGAAALVPVSTVVFAKVRESRERLRDGYLRATRIGYAAVAPILTVVAVGAPLIIPILFGPNWEQSIPVARALAVAGILVLGAMIDHGLHYGVGAPGRWFVYAVFIDALTLGTTWVLAPRGLASVAAGFVAVALLATAVRWVLVGRLVGYSAASLGAGFVISMIPVAISAAAGLGVMSLTDGISRLIALGLVGLAVGIVHVMAVRVVSRRVLIDVLDVLPVPARLGFLRRLA